MFDDSQRLDKLETQMSAVYKVLDQLAKNDQTADKNFDTTTTRFEAVDKNWESTNKSVESAIKRLEAIEKRLDALEAESKKMANIPGRVSLLEKNSKK